MEQIDSRTAFKELVAADILVYGGTGEEYEWNGQKRKAGFDLGVQYGEHFAKCYSGVEEVQSFDELKDLYTLWKQWEWVGVVAWLSKKHGYLPFYWTVEGYESQSDFRFSSLGLPEHPQNEWYREQFKEIMHLEG